MSETRREFEAWHRSEWPDLAEGAYMRAEGLYVYGPQENSWEAWQAATAAALERAVTAANGFVIAETALMGTNRSEVRRTRIVGAKSAINRIRALIDPKEAP